MSDQLQLSIHTLRDINYGDHGDRLCESYAVVEGETVEELVRRVLFRPYRTPRSTDQVLIQVMVDHD